MSLYSLWLEAHDKGILAPEWKLAHNFLTWATANGYKPEYGYKGKFTSENLLAAIPGAIEASKEFEESDKLLEGMDDAALSKMKVPELKELADKMEIDLKGITRKDDIIKAIAGG